MLNRLCGVGSPGSRGGATDVKVTPRPKLIAPDAPGPMKDVNDLHCHNPELVQTLLGADPVGKDDLTGADRQAILDEVSHLTGDSYATLGGRQSPNCWSYSRIATLDDER